MKTIVVPVDGASNIKLEVLDFDSLSTIFSHTGETPVSEDGGLEYNCTREECSWFDSVIRELPHGIKHVKVIAPVARGASGGLIGPDNTLIEAPGKGLTLAYTQKYPERVENVFRELAGDAYDFFRDTGSIRDFPGSLTLIKRFLFEEMERPELVDRAECFATYGILLSGHFLGDDYLGAVHTAGNEHSYWMCHTGARNINEKPGTPSSVSGKIASFRKLVPRECYPVYKPIGTVPCEQVSRLGLSGDIMVIPGGHDTCLSHIPIMSTYYQAFDERSGTPVIHVEAGSWTMVAQIGGIVRLPPDAYKRDIIVQGTVDGQPVVTARYGGGNDFRHVKRLVEERGFRFECACSEQLLLEVLRESGCFVLPNISPVNYQSGPFPGLQGRIINEHVFFRNSERAFVITGLTTAITTAVQVDALAQAEDIPLVLTAGGSRDPWFGRLLAALTGRTVYGMYDSNGNAVSETTTLGAAIVGKAACVNVHPYLVDVSGIGVTYHKLEPFDTEIERYLSSYREQLMLEIKNHSNS